MFVAMFAAAVLLADASATAAPETAAAPAATAAAPAKAKADKDELVCRFEETIGTRFRKKVCTTRRDAEDRARQDRDNLQRMQAMAPGPKS